MVVTNLADKYDVEETISYIVDNGFLSVALQFPDELLPDSPAVSQLLQQQLGDRARVFILADTAYNPLGVDEVAAQHLAADCVIHYGRASLVPVNSLPAFFVLPKEPFHVREVASTVLAAVGEAVRSRCEVAAAAAPTKFDAGSNAYGASPASGGFAAVVVLLDQGYQHSLQDLRHALTDQGEAGAGPGGSDEQLSQAPRHSWVFAEVTARALTPRQQQAVVPRPSASPAAPPAAAGGCCRAAAAPEGGGCSMTAASPGGADGCASGSAPESTQRQGCCGPADGVAPRGYENSGSGTAAAGGASAAASPPGPSAAGHDPSPPAAGPNPHQDRPTAQQKGSTGGDGASESRRQASDNNAGDGDDSSGSDGSCSTRCRMAGLTWSLPPGAKRRDCLYVWIGPAGSSAHQVLQLTHSSCEWLSYDPAEGGPVRQGLSDDTRRLLKRRNFMVEKARSANIVGLLVGTLGSAGFREVISSLRRLATAAGKKTYTFLMGKPNPAKLGNFPEVDVWVMVSDAQGLLLDCRDYLAPLVTPWEAATSFLGGHLDPEDYRMEMRDVMDLEARWQQQQQQQQQRSEADSLALQALGHLGLSVATRGSGNEVVARNAAEFLALKRTFKGLEMPATGALPKAAELAVEGLSGRAAVYAAEGGKDASGARDAGTAPNW